MPGSQSPTASIPGAGHIWVSGALRTRAEVPKSDELLAAPGCYTTARVKNGRARFHRAHCQRLLADAQALGLPVPKPEHVTEAFEILGQAEFGQGSGIVRITICSDMSGGLVLVGEPRALDPEPPSGRAGIAPFPHPGPGEHPGAKLTNHPEIERARDLRTQTGHDEILLFDARGNLVEGVRSSLVVVDADGARRTPGPELGGVASIALAMARERSPIPIEPTLRISREHVARARELIALNAVRGARAITQLEGQAIGSGEPGPVCRELERLLLSD